jgi:predicted nucleotidyltransferase
MHRADLIDALSALKANLVLEGVEPLYLFGSFARGEAADNSDLAIG